jgi:hypothetical protein
MIELYFVLYRIPKIMSALARERNRSPVAWSLLTIAAWFGSEIFVFVTFGLVYGVVALLYGWSLDDFPAGLQVLSYILALGSAILSFTLLRGYLSRKPSELPTPPPPPNF